MATPQNRNNTKLGSTPKQNYTAIRYGNDHGSISFGHIHKQGDVTADVLLEASDARHSVVLDKDGERKGSTQITAPGRISIESGIDKTEAEDTLFIHSWNGNIDIIASNGKLRLQGTDIELNAVGEGGAKGNIRINATETVELKGKKVIVDASSMYKLASSGMASIVANSAMEIYASTIRGVTDAVSNKDSKVGGRIIQKQNTK